MKNIKPFIFLSRLISRNVREVNGMETWESIIRAALEYLRSRMRVPEKLRKKEGT